MRLKETASPKAAEYLSGGRDDGRSCRGERLLCASGGRDAAAGFDAGRAGTVCFHQRAACGADERTALSAADAGKGRTDLGRCAARRRQGDAGRVVEERKRSGTGGGRGRRAAAEPGCGLGGGTGDWRSCAHAARWARSIGPTGSIWAGGSSLCCLQGS